MSYLPLFDVIPQKHFPLHNNTLRFIFFCLNGVVVTQIRAKLGLMAASCLYRLILTKFLVMDSL